MDLAKYLKEKKRLDPERALSYALDIARYPVSLSLYNFGTWFSVAYFRSLKEYNVNVVRLSFRLFRGMNYLHENKPPIIHRDLKPR